jgi:oxygen-dependent protoporphyrinogen oxidase
MPDFVIIGAGITGLTCGYELLKRGADVVVLESQSSVGGKIATDRDSGYLLEAGPNSLRIDSDEIDALLDDLGLTNRILHASPNAKKRFILKRGQWLQVPGSPVSAIKTPLFSFVGKLRILIEPFIKKGIVEDESIESFITRRLGSEVFHYAADPFVTGIYAGDTSLLSMRHTFPSMWRAERTHGSLIRGMMRSKKGHARKRKTEIISFPNGLSELTGALRAKLGVRVRTSDAAIRIESSEAGFKIVTPTESIDANHVICASPAYQTADQAEMLSSSFANSLRKIDYPPIGVVYLGFRVDQFANPIEGFGGLIPSIEQRKILGVIYSSSNFPGRAPADHILLTVLVGGAKHREVEEWSEDNAVAVAVSELQSLLPHSGKPSFAKARIWKRAIPQYTLGYQATLDAIASFESQHPGLHILGNYRGGIAMSSCIRTATELARRLV